MVLVPKGSSKISSDDSLTPPRLVMYEQDGGSFLGFISDVKKQKFAVLNMRERQVELNGPRLYPLPGKLPGDFSSNKQKAEYLLSLYESTLKKAEDFDVEEIWTFVHEEERDYSTKELCEQYFGDNTLDNHLMLRLALLGDKVFFRRKKEFFRPRNPDNVEELRKAKLVQEQKREFMKKTVEFFGSRLKDKSGAEVPKELEETVYQIMLVASGAPHLDNPLQKEVAELLEMCAKELKINLGGGREERAFNMLYKVGLLHQNSNLAHIRHDFDLGYSDAAMTAASELPRCTPYAELPSSERELRGDYTHLHCVTIDDPNTKDMDDALSLELSQSGYRLGIHITDVASALETSPELEKEAKHRATSVYCPDYVSNMLPPEVSEDKLSLVANEPRATLSLFIEFDKDLNLLSSKFEPSVIEVKERLSYDQVEEQLSIGSHPSEQGPGLLTGLYNIAMFFEGERLSNGALKIPKRMVIVELSEPDNLEKSSFRTIEIDENGPSRSLVGEMMIVFNNKAAEYATDNDLPFIYRTQEAPDEEKRFDPDSVPPGPAQDYYQRANLKRSGTSLEGALHATLGLKAYAQLSSPIRRYQDLINQRQLCHHLKTGEARYTGEELWEFLAQTEDPLKRASLVSRESRRFWMLKYLQRKQRKKEDIQATVLRSDLKNPLVELEEIYMTTIFKTSQKLKPGDQLDMRIAAVDPRFDFLKLEIV